MEAVEVLGALRHDVDDAEHGLRTVEHRAWPQDHLDVVDELERDASAAAEVRRAVPLLVDLVTVDEEKNVISRVARDEHAARPNLAVVEVVLRDHAEGEEVDRFGERLDAVTAQIVRRDGGARRGRGALVLGRLRSGRHDRLAERGFEIRGAVGASRSRHGEHRCRADERGDSRARGGHWITFMRLSTLASMETFCFLA